MNNYDHKVYTTRCASNLLMQTYANYSIADLHFSLQLTHCCRLLAPRAADAALVAVAAAAVLAHIRNHDHHARGVPRAHTMRSA